MTDPRFLGAQLVLPVQGEPAAIMNTVLAALATMDTVQYAACPYKLKVRVVALRDPEPIHGTIRLYTEPPTLVFRRLTAASSPAFRVLVEDIAWQLGAPPERPGHGPTPLPEDGPTPLLEDDLTADYYETKKFALLELLSRGTRARGTLLEKIVATLVSPDEDFVRYAVLLLERRGEDVDSLRQRLLQVYHQPATLVHRDTVRRVRSLLFGLGCTEFPPILRPYRW